MKGMKQRGEWRKGKQNENEKKRELYVKYFEAMRCGYKENSLNNRFHATKNAIAEK